MPSTNPDPLDKRDRGLDSLRGLMLVGMATNHITSHLQVLTDHPLGYTSFAEGFVFLSGLVAGLVYTRRRERLGLAEATRGSVLRVCTIYQYHLALFVGLLIWVNVFFALKGVPAGGTPQGMLEHPWLSLLSGATLIDQPPLLDILPMYAGFMLLLPTVLWALDAGHRGWVLALSFAGWVITNLFWPEVPPVHGVVQIGAFNWGAWQLLFIVGVIFGYSQARHTALLPRWKAHLILPALTLCVCGFLVRHWYVAAPFPTFADWVNKNNLAGVRLLNTLALFLLIHLAFKRWPRAFVWRPLELLGRHSLAVFSAHVAVAYVLFAFPQVVSATTARTWLGTVIMFAALFAVALTREYSLAKPAGRAKSRAKFPGLPPVSPGGARL